MDREAGPGDGPGPPVIRSAREWAAMLCAMHWDELVDHACRRLGGDYHRAQDVVAGVLVAVIEGQFATRFALPAPAREGVAFAVAVINNVVRNHRRRERRLAALSAVIDRGVPDSPGPWRQAERAELRAAIADALRRLTPRERQVAMLHWLELWTVRETAVHLGVAVKTAEELLRRARRKLHPQLLAHAPDPGVLRRRGGSPPPRVAEPRRGFPGGWDMKDVELVFPCPPARGGDMQSAFALVLRHPMDAVSGLVAGLALVAALTGLRVRDLAAQTVPCLFGTEVICRETCRYLGNCIQGQGICCVQWAQYYYAYIPGRNSGRDAPSWWPKLF